jgi:Oxidoreductase family, NAD-binding Rossmann fold
MTSERGSNAANALLPGVVKEAAADGNPQSAASEQPLAPPTLERIPSTQSRGTLRAKCWNALLDSMSPAVKKMVECDTFRIALVIHEVSLDDAAISAIRSPVSTCRAVAINVLAINTPPERSSSSVDDEPITTAASSSTTSKQEVQSWLEKYSIPLETMPIFYGDDGFANLLQLEQVDAVYIFVPAHLQQSYVLQALQAGKHVLLKDIVSTPSKDYREQLDCAKAVGKFIQFSTMFVHHYRVQSFLDCVCARNTFGLIRHIDAILTVNLKDLAAISVSLPLTSGQGCVRRLARYCVLIASLVLRACCTPLKATVLSHVLDEASGEPISATCRVEYTGGVVLDCQVVYSDASTRQVLTVRSETDKFATMTDFVLPHPDGLATYRVYDKQVNKLTGKMDIILAGECIDVPTGPPQNVTLWREFHHLCSSVEQYGWSQDVVQTREARILSESALQTKRILAALDESVSGAGAPIDIQYRPSHDMTDIIAAVAAKSPCSVV